MNKIVAIVGMCGSGKSVASEYLENTLGYKKVYFGGVTMKKLQEANLEVNPENEKMMREKLRKELGISTSTMSKLNKGEEVALSVLLRICDYLDCDIGDICEAVRIDTK